MLVDGVDPLQVMHIEKIFSCLLTAAVDEDPVVRSVKAKNSLMVFGVWTLDKTR